MTARLHNQKLMTPQSQRLTWLWNVLREFSTLEEDKERPYDPETLSPKYIEAPILWAFCDCSRFRCLNEIAFNMSYPGNNRYHYNNNSSSNNGGGNNSGYGPPSGPPGQYYGGGGGYGPPPGAPPGGFGGPPPGHPPGYGGGYNGYQQNGGYNQGGYNQGGYNQGGYNQGGYNQGGYNQGGYNQEANTNSYNQSSTASSGNNRAQGNYQSPEQLYQAPSGFQQFGNGAPSEYGFQYSNCSGRKKALLIGINYIGTSSQLRGCINDVQNISQFLIQNYGYKEDDMVILTDDAQVARSRPYRENMISAMQWLVKDARPNDSLFFHYSGHGGQTKDLDGDEDDGYDEVIYPLDFQTAGHITDDDLHAIMVSPLQSGVRLTAIFDSCHSGTALDLPYVYSTQGVIKQPNLAKEAGEGLLKAFGSYASGDLSGTVSALSSLVKSAVGSNSSATEKTRKTKTSSADVITFSGCKDSQTSADAMEAGKATGAMSWAFKEVMGSNPNQSYLSLLKNMRGLMSAKYSQKPQLSSSHPIDVNIQFIM
ncbi:caspase domain-containing protein [Lipomyces oligophaga]|uniref:caspase domain-containing protein n=1 Tax=Lipomyces oligophaga TaxID=45792 RepID=UPI0034CFB5E7